MNDETAITIYTGQVFAPDVVEIPPQEPIMSLDQAIAAWIQESKELSASVKTETAYTQAITELRTWLHEKGLELDSFPAAVAKVATEWAASRSEKSKRTGSVAWGTFNQRCSIISSFYRFAIRYDVLQYNPMERVKRRKAGAKDAARYIPEDVVRESLASVDRSTVEGLRNYTLITIAVNTGHRVSELAGLRLKHLRKIGNQCEITWERCKGNEQALSLLSVKATNALYRYLMHPQVYGPALWTQDGDSAVWLSFSHRNFRQAIGVDTISNICEAVLKTSKVHATRHTWAVTMSHQGATLQQIGKGLGHKNLKTTSDYMEEQMGYENPYASRLEDAFGIE